MINKFVDNENIYIPKTILNKTKNIKETLVFCYLVKKENIENDYFISNSNKIAKEIESDTGEKISNMTVRRMFNNLVEKNILIEVLEWNKGTKLSKMDRRKAYKINFNELMKGVN